MSVDCTVLVDDILQLINAEVKKHPELKDPEDKEPPLLMGAGQAYLGSEPESDDDDSEQDGEPGEGSKKKNVEGKKAQRARNNPRNRGANKKFFCTTCDAPFDFRIKRSKDPTNGKWYCAWCWRRFREKMHDMANENTEWATCGRCHLGAFSGGGRYMDDKKFYCNLCWKGWMGSLPQKSDWLPLTPEEIEERRKAEEAARLKSVSEENNKQEEEPGPPADPAKDPAKQGPCKSEVTLVQPEALPEVEHVESDVPPVAV